MERSVGPFDCIFLNGTVGAGKTVVSEAISRGEPSRHAVIDLDHLRRLVPSGADDPFSHELELKNLASVAQNYREAGAHRFILSGVIERRDELPRYAAALRTSALFICRLTASEPELDRRLRLRHAGDHDGLTWHLGRVGELSTILDLDPFENLRLDTSEASPDRLARVVREAAGWTSLTPQESARTLTVATWQVIDATMDNVRAVAVLDQATTAARATEIRAQGWSQVAGRSPDGTYLPWPDAESEVSVALRNEQWSFIVESLTEAAPIYRLIGDLTAETRVLDAVDVLTRP